LTIPTTTTSASPVEDLWIWLGDGTIIIYGPEIHIQELSPVTVIGAQVNFLVDGLNVLGELIERGTSASPPN
jgi:hypothetical protein